MENTIKTFEDACKKLKISTELPNVSMLPEKHQKSIQAYHKLIVIVEALNEGWEPDWTNSNEKKYLAWQYYSGSGFVHHDYVYVGTITRTAVGSRLCYRSRELALYAGEQFESIYNDFLK